MASLSLLIVSLLHLSDIPDLCTQYRNSNENTLSVTMCETYMHGKMLHFSPITRQCNYYYYYIVIIILLFFVILVVRNFEISFISLCLSIIIITSRNPFTNGYVFLFIFGKISVTRSRGVSIAY